MSIRLENVFTSTEEEVLTPVQAEISGCIPDWLTGSLLRIGPGIFNLKSGFSMNHFCDGYAVIVKFTFKNGKVEFIKRTLRSDAYEKAERIGKPGMVEFATKAYSDPAKSLLAKAIGTLLPDVTDNCNSNIVKVGNSYFAVSDTCMFRVIDPNDLSTGDKVDMYKHLGVHMVCAHTIKDRRGDSYAMGTSLVTGLKYNLIKIPDNSNTSAQVFKDAKVIASVSPRWKTCVGFYHSFAITDNYVIFIEQPYIMSGVKLLASQFKGRSMKDCLDWAPDQMNRFIIIEKASGKVLPTKYRSNEPIFYFHQINAYEDNGEIILDMIGGDNPDVMDKMFLTNLRKGEYHTNAPFEARRLILPLIDNIKKVEEGVNLVKTKDQCTAVRKGDTIELDQRFICRHYHEFPIINMKYFAKQYRYYYATGIYYEGEYQNSIIKVDIETGEVKKWYAGDNLVPSEPIFIEKPNSTSEDDGILLICITTQPSENCRLVILNALTMELIASATIPYLIPFSFHGVFIEEST